MRTHGKHKMYEAAIGITWHTILQKRCFFVFVFLINRVHLKMIKGLV